MPNGNNIVKCGSCNRQFKHAAALSQHRVAMHAKAGARGPAPARRRSRKNNGRQAGARGGGAPVAVPMNLVARSSESATLSGVDRFYTIEDVSVFGAGELIIDSMFEPGDVPRLRTVSKAFQRVRYNYLRFRVEPQISTATSGGYVASFVRDAADVAPRDSEGLLSFMTAAQGSVTTKWWQKSVVNPRIDKFDYYTSLGVEVREYSPGRFLLAVDGKATQKGNLTVFVEWSVSLHTASLETEKTLPQSHVALMDLYTNVDDPGIWGKKDGHFYGYAIAELISGAKLDLVMSLKNPVYVQETTSITRAVWYLHCANEKQIRMALEGPDDYLAAGPATEILLFRQGTEFSSQPTNRVFRDPASSCRKPMRTVQPKLSGSDSSSVPSQTWEGKLTMSLQRLGDLMANFCLLQEELLLRAPHKSTVYRPSSVASLPIMVDEVESFEELPHLSPSQP